MNLASCRSSKKVFVAALHEPAGAGHEGVPLTEHGGPDANGVPRWDFSTNSNACGPAPSAWRALRRADPTRYPDPSHHALRAALAALHGVSPERIVPAASASEFIRRATQAVAQRWPGAGVHAALPGYADYAAAAGVVGLRRVDDAGAARLVWHTEPSSPRGETRPPPAVVAGALLVIDCAYEPLRLQGDRQPLPPTAWQLWSPNKALGLVGVRGAYAVAPDNAPGERWRRAFDALAPSWPLGAHGVAMLHAWAQPAAQAWVRASLDTLREWKHEQLARCASLGWVCEPSVVPFFIARWPALAGAARARERRIAHLRDRGIKLRDTASLGLPGCVRVSVQAPSAQRALVRHWREAGAR